MDLSFFIPSKMRRKVLFYFVDDPDSQVYVRELARELKSAPQVVYRELINLENWGFLFSSAQGNQRVFRLNKKFIFYPAIDEIFKLYEIVHTRKVEIIKTYKYEDLVKSIEKIPIPKELEKELKKAPAVPRNEG